MPDQTRYFRSEKEADAFVSGFTNRGWRCEKTRIPARAGQIPPTQEWKVEIFSTAQVWDNVRRETTGADVEAPPEVDLNMLLHDLPERYTARQLWAAGYWIELDPSRPYVIFRGPKGHAYKLTDYQCTCRFTEEELQRLRRGNAVPAPIRPYISNELLTYRTPAADDVPVRFVRLETGNRSRAQVVSEVTGCIIVVDINSLSRREVAAALAPPPRRRPSRPLTQELNTALAALGEEVEQESVPPPPPSEPLVEVTVVEDFDRKLDL